jgi:pyridoxine 4-dehydrogenase
VASHPYTNAFTAIKAGIDLCPPGVKMVLNSADFYGPGLGVGNLELVSRFFEKYPEYTDRAFLSVKVRRSARRAVCTSR